MNKSTLTIIGENIRKRRESFGMSQEELGIKSGCHRNYIGLLERGERNPSILKLLTICNVLEIDISKVIPPN